MSEENYSLLLKISIVGGTDSVEQRTTGKREKERVLLWQTARNFLFFTCYVQNGKGKFADSSKIAASSFCQNGSKEKGESVAGATVNAEREGKKYSEKDATLHSPYLSNVISNWGSHLSRGALSLAIMHCEKGSTSALFYVSPPPPSFSPRACVCVRRQER